MRNSCNVFSGGRKRPGRMRVSPCKLLRVSSFSSLPAVALAKAGGAGGECIRFTTRSQCSRRDVGSHLHARANIVRPRKRGFTTRSAGVKRR
jgi:hypothetical protein